MKLFNIFHSEGFYCTNRNSGKCDDAIVYIRFMIVDTYIWECDDFACLLRTVSGEIMLYYGCEFNPKGHEY